MANLDPERYTIAWIAPLEIEVRAALLMLDNRHQGTFAMGRGDDYIFQAGDICGHNIIIATLPAGQEYGNGSAAALAGQVKKFFQNLWFGLLVGVAAGLPNLSRSPPLDIRLGDVLVGLPTGESAGLIPYNLGKETGDEFQLTRSGQWLANTEPVVRSAIGSIKLKAPNDAEVFLAYYERIKDEKHANGTYIDPGQEKDTLYQVNEGGTKSTVERERRPDSERTRVWYGPIGTGDKLMKNARIRDELRDKHNIIGLEMEAAGTMNRIPVGVIRGVCDYGDEHKNKEWQPYAAAMAAAYAKAVLAQIGPKNVVRKEGATVQNVYSLSKLAQLSKARLVLGTVDMAGVIGLFKDSVDMFSLIVDSRHLGRDYEILETKLDIEKMLLLQWADRVKLLSPSYDKRLDDRDTQRLIAKILESVATLLTNAPELQQRYGMNEAPADSLAPENRGALVSGTLRVSDARWERFLKDYNALNKPSVTIEKRVRWMIRDKQKFEGLVQDLAHFTTKLNEAIPIASDDASTRIMIDEDLEAICDLRGLKILLEASKGLQKTITELTQHVLSEKCKDHILNKLWFRKIDDRRESIPLAHKKTLRWVLEPPGEEVSWDNLPMWLRSGSGIFWVVGKAGSGKSTLMKHLYLSDSTRALLSEWAKGERCFICNFFFMNLGTVEQKSQEGLSRTLLYQILSANRDLIPKVLPHMWKEIYETEQKNGPDDISLPSQAETRHAFSFIGSSGERIGWFCFLIDGLDEFIGDHMDGIAFIKDLAANEHVKVIVSSRPISDCVAAFSDLSKLRLQDLNRDDISLYVNDTIGSHEYMRNLIRMSSEECEKIIKDIIDKSSGVFLWVVLACRSLLSGFADYDNISELRRRVDELPPELEDMFQHMLGKIKTRYREQGARLLRICYTHQTASWPNASPDIYAVGLALVQDYNTFPVGIECLPDEDKYDLCIRLEGRLRSRCGGLLEVSRHSEMPCLCSTQCSDHANCINIRVLFMHRTVFEFLSNEQVWEIECLRLPPDKPFDPNTALSLYGLHLTKQSLHAHHGRRSAEQTASFLWEGLRWAVLADSQEHGSSETFFNSLSAITEDHELSCFGASEISLKCLYTQVRENRRHPETQLRLLLAIEAGAVNYVGTHPGLQALVQHKGNGCSCQPVLLHAISRRILDATFQTSALSEGDGANVPSQDIVNLLLRSGCDPNQELSEYRRKTLWKVLLERINLRISDYNASGIKKWAELVESFLEAGADPKALDLHKAKWETQKGQAILQRIARRESIDPVTSLGATRVNPNEELEGRRVVKRPRSPPLRLSENTALAKAVDPEHQKRKGRFSGMKIVVKSGLWKKRTKRLR